MGTELPRRLDGGRIRAPVTLTGQDGEMGEGAAEIGPDDAGYAEWDAFLKAQPVNPLDALTKAAEGGAQPPAPPPDERWPAWAVDAALSSIVADQLIAALSAAVADPAALAAEFAEWAAGHEPTVAAVRAWLRSKGLAIDLETPIRAAWIQGAAIGAHAADAVLAHLAGESVRAMEPGFTIAIDWGAWKPGDVAAARALLSADGMTEFLSRLLRDAGVTISRIEANRLDELAAVLADGLEAGKSPAEIAHAITGLVNDRKWAMMVAWTETNRAQSAAALAAYQQRDVPGKEWFTASDQRVCPICHANEAEGPIPLDGRFASGESHPPAHPRCRCALLPVMLLPEYDPIVKSASAGQGDAEALHRYWTKGKGLAVWLGSPHPWTTLYHHLLRHMGGDVDKAKRTASQWFHDATGMWPGERKGRNPVGRG